jgi:basic membrane protein A
VLVVLLRENQQRDYMLRMKYKLQCILPVLMFIMLAGCSAQKNEEKISLANSKIVVLLPGEAGDLSWNDMNYEGILTCQEDLGITIECEFNLQEVEFEMKLTEYAQAGYDLICSAGNQFAEAVNSVAQQYPDTTFCMINGDEGKFDNIGRIRLKEYEASYLAALIAGNLTEQGVIGMIGAYPNTAMKGLLNNYEGYMKEILKERGITYETSLRAYTNSWSDQMLGDKMARQMIDSGADILFVYTNESGLGCIQAAEEKGAKIIGFCGNPTVVYPDTVIASIQFDSAKIYEYIFYLYETGALEGADISLGIQDGIFKPIFSDAVPEEVRAEVNFSIKNEKNVDSYVNP